MMPDSEMLDGLLRAAASHGQEGDPDHEIGDLETIIFACWVRLTPQQRREVSAEVALAE